MKTKLPFSQNFPARPKGQSHEYPDSLGIHVEPYEQL